MLLRSLGAYVNGTQGDSEKGISVVRKALQEAGVPDEVATLDLDRDLAVFAE